MLASTFWEALVVVSRGTTSAGTVCWLYHAAFVTFVFSATSAHVQRGVNRERVEDDERRLSAFHRTVRRAVNMRVGAHELAAYALGMFNVFDTIANWPARESPFSPRPLYSGFCVPPNSNPWWSAFVLVLHAGVSWVSVQAHRKYI
jgi:hypothetical protein